MWEIVLKVLFVFCKGFLLDVIICGFEVMGFGDVKFLVNLMWFVVFGWVFVYKLIMLNGLVISSSLLMFKVLG